MWFHEFLWCRTLTWNVRSMWNCGFWRNELFVPEFLLFFVWNVIFYPLKTKQVFNVTQYHWQIKLILHELKTWHCLWEACCQSSHVINKVKNVLTPLLVEVKLSHRLGIIWVRNQSSGTMLNGRNRACTFSPLTSKTRPIGSLFYLTRGWSNHICKSLPTAHLRRGQNARVVK